MTQPIPCEHCYHLPTFKRVEQQQQPYRGQWNAIVARVADTSPDVPVYRRDLDRWLAEIADAKPDGHVSRAVNTTEYGRE